MVFIREKILMHIPVKCKMTGVTVRMYRNDFIISQFQLNFLNSFQSKFNCVKILQY